MTCPNCGREERLVGDECFWCGFTGWCVMCGDDTDFYEGDQRYCSDGCARQAVLEGEPV